MANKKKLRAKLKLIIAQRKAFAKSVRIADKEIARLTKLCRRKMRKGGGRAKGNGFENKVAKIIVAAFAEYHITQRDCYRTPLSGGHRFAKHEDPGDLVISKKLRVIFPFHVECKFYKDVNLRPFWDPQKKWKPSWLPGQWLKQATDACKKSSIGMPMLVFKSNGEQILAAVPLKLRNSEDIRPMLWFKYEGETWTLVRFSKLLSQIKKTYEELTC